MKSNEVGKEKICAPKRLCGTGVRNEEIDFPPILKRRKGGEYSKGQLAPALRQLTPKALICGEAAQLSSS
jgi:hypothetical protein